MRISFTVTIFHGVGKLMVTFRSYPRHYATLLFIQTSWTSFRNICGLWKGNPCPRAVWWYYLLTLHACRMRKSLAVMFFRCVSSDMREELGRERLACIRASTNFKVKYPPSCCRETVSPEGAGLFYLCWPIQGGQDWLKNDFSNRTEQGINNQSGFMDWWIIHRLCFHSLYINFEPWFHPFMSDRVLGEGWYTFNVSYFSKSVWKGKEIGFKTWTLEVKVE